MHRVDVLQRIIERTNAQTYLEIGVRRGATFLRIRAKHKLAVDPDFRIARRDKIRSIFTNPSNILNQYFSMTSDEFFSKARPILAGLGIDVVFVDGLHTYVQSLNDVLNSLEYLTQRGVIVLHDTNPTGSSIASESLDDSIRQGAAGWSGDVWKTIVHLRSQRPDLDVFVLDCDTGLGIVSRRTVNAPALMVRTALEDMTYSDLARDRERLLGLRPPEYFDAFLASI